MFSLKEFIIKNLIDGVKRGDFTKPYASIMATNYVVKGILTESDVERFDKETTEEVVEETELTVDEILAENNTEEPLE